MLFFHFSLNDHNTLQLKEIIINHYISRILSIELLGPLVHHHCYRQDNLLFREGYTDLSDDELDIYRLEVMETASCEKMLGELQSELSEGCDY